MAISVFPAPVTSSINASSITAVSANTLYGASITLDAAIYTITCASGTTTNIDFYSGAATLITSATTSSGTVTVNLASNADRVRLWTNTGSNIVVTIAKTASALTNNISGTLDTITTTSTYTGTSTSGYAYAVLVGGGGGGAGGSNSTAAGGGGGGSGGVGASFVTLTGSMSVVIGDAGTAGAIATNGGAGGASTFAGMTCNGGGGGVSSTRAGGAGGTVTGATVSSTGGAGGAGGVSDQGQNAGTTTLIYPFVVNGTTGGGGGGSGGPNTQGAGGGSGIGTGGGAASSTSSGFGAGGKGGVGGNTTGVAGTAGRPGVLYILRF
jgi:hypothetical protein